MKKRILILPIIMPLIWLACQTGGLFGKLYGKSVILNPDKWLEIKEDGWLCDCSAIRNDLHFSPRWDLTNGLQKTMEWYYKNSWIKPPR